MNRVYGLLGDALLITAATIFFVWCSLNRLVAGDEGFYLLASRLVMQGQVPYRDFFYPQMPLLPYVYGIWMRLSEESWASARILSAGFASITGLLIYLRCRALFDRAWGCIALLLFVSSNFVFPWLTVAKTYSLSTMLLFLSYFVCTAKIATRGKFLAAGVMFGLSVNTRLFFAAAVPLFYAYIFFMSDRFPQRMRYILAFTLGGFLTAVPLLYFLRHDFETFWFNNMGYHLIRSNKELSDSLQGKVDILKSILSIRDAKSFDGFQFLMLSTASLIGVLASLRQNALRDLSLPIALVLGIVNLIPTPTYIQYFCTVTPFLCVYALIVLRWIYVGIWPLLGRFGRTLAASLGCSLLLVYVLPFAEDLNRYTRTGIGVIGISSPGIAAYRTVRSYDSLAPVLSGLVLPGSYVVAKWPGYVIGSTLNMLPGLENDFGLSVADKISLSERKRLRIITSNEMCEAVQSRIPSAAVLTSGQRFPKCLRNSLKHAGYTKITRFNDLEIHTKEYNRHQQHSHKKLE